MDALTTTASPSAPPPAATTQAFSNAAGQAQAAEDSGKINADFDTFLSLLTAQLRNQDPLNPADSTQFVAQLAQFSGVEQQVRANASLDAILGALGGDGPARLASWLGAEVAAPAALPFTGAPVALTAPPANAGAVSAALVVRAAGEGGTEGPIVARVTADPRATALSWDGVVPPGATAPEGFYRFSLERTNAEGAVSTVDLAGYSRVTEARLVEGAPKLVLEGGDVVDAKDVTALRKGA